MASGSVFFVFEKVSTFIVTEEKEVEAPPAVETKTEEETSSVVKERETVVEEEKKEEEKPQADETSDEKKVEEKPAETSAKVALTTLGCSTRQIVRAIALHLVTSASKNATFCTASWCHNPFSSKSAIFLFVLKLKE